MVNVVHLRKVFLSHVSGAKEFSCENLEYAPEGTYSIVYKVHLIFLKKQYFTCKYMKIICSHCGEETNVRDPRSYKHY